MVNTWTSILDLKSGADLEYTNYGELLGVRGLPELLLEWSEEWSNSYDRYGAAKAITANIARGHFGGVLFDLTTSQWNETQLLRFLKLLDVTNSLNVQEYQLRFLDFANDPSEMIQQRNIEVIIAVNASDFAELSVDIANYLNGAFIMDYGGDTKADELHQIVGKLMSI